MPRSSRTDAFDDSSEVAVADGFPVLTERDDRVVDVFELAGVNTKPSVLASLLHGMAA